MHICIFGFALLYWSGAKPSRCSAFSIENIPRLFFWILASISNIRIYQSLWGLQLLGSLWIRRSSTKRYHLRSIPYIREDWIFSILFIQSLWSSASFLTTTGVISEDPEGVDSLSCLNYFRYSSRGIGWEWYGRDWVMESGWWIYSFVWDSIFLIYGALPRSRFSL